MQQFRTACIHFTRSGIHPEQFAMERAMAMIFIVFCTMLATSNLPVLAFPMTSYQQRAFVQQSNGLDGIVEALGDAVDEVIADAIGGIGGDLKTALSEFLHEKVNNFISFGEVNFDEDHIELTVDPSSTLDLFSLLPFDSPLPLPQISLDHVVYSFDTTELEVATRGYGSETIIPDVLQLENIALSLVVELQDINTLVVTFTGDFVIGGTTIPVTVVYTHSSGEVEITADVPSITINFQSVATQLVGLDLPSALHGSISIPNFALSGKITSSGDKELIVSATGGDIHVYIIYQKTDVARKAIAVELANIGLASVLDDVVGLDISGIPFFGTAVLPTIALTYATQTIEDLPGDTFADSPLLSSMGTMIEEDLTALIMFEFSDDPIMLHYSGGIPTFQPATPGSLDVNSLISAIPGFDLSALPLPPGVDGLLELSIDSFAIDIDARSIELSVGFPGSLTFFDGFLTIHDPMVVIEKSPQGIKIDVEGDLSISGSGFDVDIYRDDESGDYVLEASADELPITDVFDQFQSEVLPSELNSLIDSLPFFSFSIDDPSISFPLSSSPLQIQLAGVPVIAGYSTVHFASVLIRQGGKTLFVQGFELGSVNLADFLRGITGFNFNSIPLLNQDLEAAILISPVTLPNVQLTGDKLSGFTVTRGLSVQATMQFPPDCSSDAFCAVAAFLLGEDAQLAVRGTIASATSFTLFAGVSNINLGNGIVMSEAGVEIQGGAMNSVGIVGSVDLSDPDITLAGRVFLSTSGVELEMTMSGCWENAFGADWLTICSLQASVAMIPGVTLTGLSIGGEVRVGDESCGTPLIATGFVGIDVLTPSQNYYYVNLEGSTTVGTILDAFCIDFSVPAPLAESGFPNGFLSSFSLFGVELPHVPLSIPQGYRFKGTLNILGLEASADINIGLPNGLYVGVSLPPINIAGGILQMFASSTDRSNGPFLTADVDISPTPNVDIQASGYLRVLGISLETSLTITNTQFIFEIEGNFLDLFEASLRISASYGNINSASFRVQGSFTNNLYSTLEDLIKNGLDAAAEDATRAFDAVQRDLDNAQDTLDSASRVFDDAQDEVDKAQRAFDDAVDEVASLRRDVDGICSTRRCGSACVGCPDGFTCCATAWGVCICTHPTWDSCCFRIPDPICEAANLACLALKEPIKLALLIAEEVVDSSRFTLEIAKAGLEIPQLALLAARETVTVAELAVDGIEAAYAAGLKAAEFIVTVGLNGLINIREISFDVGLSAAAGGSFSGSVTASFFGSAEVTISFNINLYDIISMVTQLVDQIGDGLSSLF